MTWPQYQLQEIAESIDYGVSESAVDRPVGPKFLRITDIQDDQVNWHSVPYCEAPEQKLRAARLRQGDIVFARTGATTGKSFLIRECPDDAIFASYLIRVRAAPSIEPAFLAHFFRSETYWQQISATAVGAAQPGINATKLGQLEIPLPPLDEQKRIAAILDQADELRRKRQRALDRLNQLGQAIFMEMFGQKIDSDSTKTSIGEVSKRVTKGESPNWQGHSYVDHGALFVTSENVGWGELLRKEPKFISMEFHEGKLFRSKLKQGDILVNLVGASIGRVCIFESDFAEANINQAVAVVTLKEGVRLSSYLQAYMLSPWGQEQILGSRVEGARANISLADVRRFEFYFPLDDELAKFNECMDRVTLSRNLAHSALEVCETLFASLQHRAFRGELSASNVKEAAT